MAGEHPLSPHAAWQAAQNAEAPISRSVRLAIRDQRAAPGLGCNTTRNLD
jgi:hypothetical protein